MIGCQRHTYTKENPNKDVNVKRKIMKVLKKNNKKNWVFLFDCFKYERGKGLTKFDPNPEAQKA